MILAVSFFFLPTVESHVLKAKQAAAIAQVTHEGQETRASPHAVNVQKTELGKPLAILTVPTIALKIPVYAGTSEKVLQNGAGIMEGTGDLSGGKGKNPVLASHSGLAEDNLFSDLPKVKKDDVFFLDVAGKQQEYQVISKTIDAISDLQAQPQKYIAPDSNQEQVTLLTCVSKKGSINSNDYRLLVKGVRIPFHANDLTRPADKSFAWKWLIGASCLFLVILVGILTRTNRKGA
ncbi:class C sortase [Enterococcus gilvus]